MIETTARLVQERGLHGVSLNDILTESGAPRGSLYFHFPGGKQALVLEALKAGIEEATEALRDCLAEADSPARGVEDFFRLIATEMKDSNYAFGCPVAAIVLDRPEIGSDLARTCQAAFDHWAGMVCEALMAAGLEPDRANRLALTVLGSLEGALLMARGQASLAPIEAIGSEIAEWIAATLPLPPVTGPTL
jgi:TetR/AcrR family transcriptional regulator, lmrAB and yxaGH operons repressor